MIQMTPLLSWILMILLGALAVAFVSVLKKLDHKIFDGQQSSKTDAETVAETTETLADVIELRPNTRGRHLTLIKGSRAESSNEFYDWKVQGL